MTRGPGTRAAACALAALALALTALAFAVPAGAALLEPRGNKVWFGISDTGDPADFGAFSEALDKHPAVIESFRNWGSDFPESIRRWQTARARPMIHVTTADNNDGHEIITPKAIAEGGGDDYLIRLNRLFSEKDMRGYLRPLGEPNRCLNVYAAYDCGGAARGGPHTPRWYKLAFRRFYVIVHGGGKAKEINRRLAEAGLGPLNATVGGLPKAPVAIIWSPLPSGSPTVPGNRPRHFWPGSRWVDWVRHRLLRRLPGMEVADRPLQPLPEQALRPDRVGDRKRRRSRLRPQALQVDRPAPALQDARLLPGLRQHQRLPDPELPGQPRGAQGPPALRPLPGLRAGCAAATAAAAGRDRDAWDLSRFAPGLNGCRAVMLE